jgi:hypothetical protein
MAAPGHPTWLRLDFPGLSRPVFLRDAPDVLAGLSAAISAWLPTVTAVAQEAVCSSPLSVVRKHGSAYTLRSAFLEGQLDGLPAASAVCAVIADLAQCFFEERPGSLALHCGAFSIQGRLVAMTGEARAGKSTLMARLTAEPDISVFCDDVLPVLPDGLAIGLGIAPRLRLPLPSRAGEAFRAHVAASRGPRDDKYAYVTAPSIAPHGTRAPLAVLVTLARQEDGPARLHRLEPAEAVHHLLSQNMADPGDGSATFDRVTELAGSLVCLKLVYADLEEAVALIRRAFGGTNPYSTDVDVGPPIPSPRLGVREPAPPVSSEQYWRRNGYVAIRRMGEDTFLWHAAHQSYFRLNPVAAAVWTLLDAPDSAFGLAETLSEAFPEEDPARIVDDVALLLGALAEERLIAPAEAAEI